MVKPRNRVLMFANSSCQWTFG